MQDKSIIRLVAIIAFTVLVGTGIDGYFNLERTVAVQEQKTDRTKERANAWHLPWTKTESMEVDPLQGVDGPE